jgi:hypothetical protein
VNAHPTLAGLAEFAGTIAYLLAAGMILVLGLATFVVFLGVALRTFAAIDRRLKGEYHAKPGPIDEDLLQ